MFHVWKELQQQGSSVRPADERYMCEFCAQKRQTPGTSVFQRWKTSGMSAGVWSRSGEHAHLCAPRRIPGVAAAKSTKAKAPLRKRKRLNRARRRLQKGRQEEAKK